MQVRQPANIKVVCLGLSRTGTTSLSAALDILGFGPCYQTYRLAKDGQLDLYPWIKMAEEGSATPEDLDRVLGGYCSVLDQPPALFPEALYNAYPDAKFILTTRDPEKWEQSIQETMLPIARRHLETEGIKTELDRAFKDWLNCSKMKIHRRDISTDTKGVLFRHNAHVTSIIPPEKLLVFDVTEGWDKLVTFLGVSTPTVPFPHLNDSESFKKALLQSH